MYPQIPNLFSMNILFNLDYEISMKLNIDIHILKNDEVIAEIIQKEKLFRFAILISKSRAMIIKIIQIEEIII